MIQFYLRYNLAKKAPVGIYNSNREKQGYVNLPFVSDQGINKASAFVFINIHYSDKQIEITSLLPVDDLKNQIFKVNPNSFSSHGSYAAYSAIALEELIEKLNHGVARTNDGVQPTVEYMFNGERYQWSIVPL